MSYLSDLLIPYIPSRLLYSTSANNPTQHHHQNINNCSHFEITPHIPETELEATVAQQSEDVY